MASKPIDEALERRVRELEGEALSRQTTEESLRRDSALESRLESAPPVADRIRVSGIHIEWKPKQGTCTFESLPVAMMWVDTTLTGLMSGVQAMVGTERFVLALQSEGRKSVEADWQVISQFPDFREGFEAIANIAAVAGWGHWEMTSLDEHQRECRFRVMESWEGRYQRALGVSWGSGMLAGKMAGYCSKLFGTNCWAEQTRFISRGEPFDEFLVKPSSRSIEKEIESLLQSDEATRADMAVALRTLEKEIAERRQVEEALREREEETKRLAEESAIMAEISRIISSTLVIDDVYELFAREVRKLIPFDRIGISIVDVEKGMGISTYIAGKDVLDREVGIPYPLEGTGIAEMIRTQSVVLMQTDDLNEVKDRFPKLLSTFQSGFRSIMNVPLLAKGQVIGALLLRSIQSDAYQIKHVQLAERVGRQIAGAIASAQLYVERKRVEEALRESEERYRNILESIEEGYYEVDISGNLRFFNDSVCELLGYSRDELTGMNSRQYTDGESAKALYRAFNEVYRTGTPTKGFDWQVIRKDGSRRFVEASVSLIRDSEDNAIGFRGIARDVTNRKLAEEEKQRLEAQLRQAQKMEAIGTLAGGIAHDFNNLLMGIQGNASLMILDIDSSHPHFERLRNIEQYVQSGAELTRQLLGFARGGKYEVKAIDLNDLIHKSSQMFGRTKKEIKIHGKYQKGIWPVEADRGQIEQVLLNLFVNAWQAMPAGGELYLQTENVHLDEEHAQRYQLKPGRYVMISVTDTGVGMDKKTQERIFDPFFTTKELGRGTGLGLASAYGIVRSHDGVIDVHSEKGMGATFHVYLPASDERVVEVKQVLEGLSTGSETILLVDDEKMIIDVAKGIMERLGYKVLIARGGKEAIETYKENQDRIDMVILDMIMPGMGGGETYDQLKEMKEELKVLLSSGYSIDGQAKEIMDRGCDGFIQKPFNMRDLSQKIRDILDKDHL